jgi:ERF superfamily.
MQKLAGKLVKVMAECSYVVKNGNNNFHHYQYVTSADVLEKVNAALTKYKIGSVVLPELLSMVDVKTVKGNIEKLAVVKIDIMLIDSESEETLSISGLGSGQDAGDKAVMKAQTAAIKYAYLLSLAISTGDDPEADAKTDVNSGVVPQIYRGARKPVPVKTGTSNICEDCGTTITERVERYSIGKYGKPLCMDCQKKLQGIA